MMYNDPFFGEIELEKIGELSYHALGCTTIREIYKAKNDRIGNFYIKTWHEDFHNHVPEESMECITKNVVNVIFNYLKNNPPDNQEVVID